MFVQTWNKYLPVIRILLKRSVTADQRLDMDKNDFQRASGGKKVKFAFLIRFTKGRFNSSDAPTQLIKDFAAALQQNEAIYDFLKKSEIEFSMSSSFQLLIKNVTPAEAEATGDVESSVNNDEA
jgi:hypothetical protein